MLIVDKVVRRMSELYTEFFTTLTMFRKLRFGDMLADMTKNDGMTLMAIAHFEELNGGVLTVSELAERIHAKSSAVSRTLKSLEDAGLVERTVNKNDRRNTYVTLTEKGMDRRNEVSREMDDFGQAVFRQMGEEDMQKLNAYLKELYEITKCEIEKRSRNNRKEQ